MSNDTDPQKRDKLKASASTYWKVSLGLLAFALFPNERWVIVLLIFVGTICALIGTWIYLESCLHRKLCGVANLARVRLEDMDWVLILVLFGMTLIKDEIDWLRIPAYLSILAGSAIWIHSVLNKSLNGE